MKKAPTTPPLTPTNEELYKKFADNKEDISIRNELMVRNQPLVTFVLNKYYSTGNINFETRTELLQEGCIGLLHAVEGFDHTLGFKFSTYAVWWIKQAINNYLINVNPIIRVPTHIKAAQNKLLKKLRLTNQDLYDISDINPRDYDLSEKMLGSIQSALQSKQITSFNKPLYADGELSTLESILPDDNESNEPDCNIDRELVVLAIKNALKAMPEKRRLILLLRYDVLKEKDVPAVAKTKKATKQ